MQRRGWRNRRPGPGGPWSTAAHRSSIPRRRPARRARPRTNSEMISSVKDAGSSQNEMLFMRGKRHVRRADHQRHHPVAEAADHRRHDHEEDHDQAMRGGEHVEHVRVVEELQARVHQFQPHPDRQHAADQSAHQRKHEVHRADVLVVGRVDVAPPTVRVVVVVLAVNLHRRSHDSSPSRYRPLTIPGTDRHHRAIYCAAATLVGGTTPSRAYFFFASSSHAANACSLTTRTAIGMKA